MIELQYENIQDVNYKLIKNKRDSETNQKKLEEYVQFYDMYRTKTLKQILPKIKEGLETLISKPTIDKDDEQELDNIFREKKKVDLQKTYKQFLNKKRGK
jgi:thiaminase